MRTQALSTQVAVLGCARGSWARSKAVLRSLQLSASEARTLHRTCPDPPDLRQVGEDALVMLETGWGVWKAGVGYEDITQDLPSESQNVPSQDIKQYSSPRAWIKEHTAEIVGGWRQKFWANVLHFSLKVKTVGLEESTWHCPSLNEYLNCPSQDRRVAGET